MIFFQKQTYIELLEVIDIEIILQKLCELLTMKGLVYEYLYEKVFLYTYHHPTSY